MNTTAMISTFRDPFTGSTMDFVWSPKENEPVRTVKVLFRCGNAFHTGYGIRFEDGTKMMFPSDQWREIGVMHARVVWHHVEKIGWRRVPNAI
jgi:hypothetical protein